MTDEMTDRRPEAQGLLEQMGVVLAKAYDGEPAARPGIWASPMDWEAYVPHKGAAADARGDEVALMVVSSHEPLAGNPVSFFVNFTRLDAAAARRLAKQLLAAADKANADREGAGMKQTELRPCAGCGKGVMHAGSPVFYRAHLSYMAVNLNAVRRQHGLELAMGSPVLARVMGPDDDMAASVTSSEICVCLDCAVTLPLAEIVDRAARAEEAATAEERAP